MCEELDLSFLLQRTVRFQVQMSFSDLKFVEQILPLFTARLMQLQAAFDLHILPDVRGSKLILSILHYKFSLTSFH